MTDTTDGLAGFTKGSFTSTRGRRHDLYRLGSGPAVVIIHEVPGITPLVASFARRVADEHMTAVVVNLLGTPGRPVSIGYALGSITRACVSREFTLLALEKTSPIVGYLRELAAHEHHECGGPGVGAVGMCLTGGFALAMAVEPCVVAPVMSQPALPLPVTRGRRSDLGLSDADLAAVKHRAAAGLCVMGLRFSGDSKSPGERFARLRAELGSNFIGVEIDSSHSNPWGYQKAAHSVLTEDYSDAPGSPTRHALEDVLAFLSSRLGVAPATASGE